MLISGKLCPFAAVEALREVVRCVWLLSHYTISHCTDLQWVMADDLLLETGNIVLTKA